MAERARDWFRQAEADLRHARNARDSQDYDWSAFASQQAEKLSRRSSSICTWKPGATS